MKVLLDAFQLRRRCLSPQETFFKEGTVVPTPDDQFYIYKDNGASILAVAHLDHVDDSTHFHVNKIQGGQLIMAGSLDDRLGVHVILDVLPRFLGERAYDILLTTGEESGKTTAKHFTTEKKYKWIFSFDRKLDDVVVYQYWDHKWNKALKDAGFTVGNGSFSCIGSLSFLGCRGVNVGVGYDEYHTPFARAWWPMTADQVERFVTFYYNNWSTHWPYESYKSYVPAPKVYPAPVSGTLPESVGTAPTGGGTSTEGNDTKEETTITPAIKVPALSSYPRGQLPMVVVGFCPVCHKEESQTFLSWYSVCEDCLTGENAIECPSCHATVSYERYSFRAGQCYDCLLGDENPRRWIV